MSKLLDDIRADAAHYLALPPGSRLTEAGDRYQRFLKRQALRLKLAHNKGAGGREVCAARALVVDLVFEAALATVAAAPVADKPGPAYSVVALGGYGRSELCPHSDIDVMFLHDRADPRTPPVPSFMALMEEAWLFNVFPKVSPLVRNSRDCTETANKDLRSKTSLIEARLVCGDAALFEKMRKRLVAECVKGYEHEYIEQRLKDQAGRRERFGNTPFVQEPNLKNGCGGLRDYQNLLWMAFFKYRVRTTKELEDRGLISPAERAALDDAYEFLLRVRNDLHYRGERANDQLSKSVQPAVARAMGFVHGSPRERLERLMRAYYRHVRNIHDMTRNLEQRLALLPQPGRLPGLRHLLRERRKRAAYELDGFKFVDGQVLAASDRIFTEQPRRIMRAFLNAQQRGLQLHPELNQLLRNHAHLVTRAFREDGHVHEAFLTILKQRGHVAPALRQMHELGLLGAYLPAFGRLTGLVQHEFYHQYTADEHTLVCLEKLDAVWNGQAPEYAPYAEIFQRVQRPEVLYLALLLHDTGKGDGPDHSRSGGRIAASVARRLRLDDAAAASLEGLVLHHLAMVDVSQKRDLDDPHEIRRFAELVRTPEQLAALTLLTLADSLGTSDKLWNAFKNQLLLTLYRRTEQHLAGEFEIEVEGATRRERLLTEIRRAAPSELAADEVGAHFSALPTGYFLHASSEEVLADLQLAHRFLERQVLANDHLLEPVVAWRHDPAHGCSEVKCCTWDRHGLFGRIAGALTAAGLNILGAEIYTRADDFVIDTFLVADPATHAPANVRAVERFEKILGGVLLGEMDLADLLRPRRSTTASAYLPPAGERLPTRVVFDNDTSPTRSIIEVETEDRLGLLYSMASALSELGVEIVLAKINTAKGAASDTFYVTEGDGQKIAGPQRLRQIEARLHQAIQRLDPA